MIESVDLNNLTTHLKRIFGYDHFKGNQEVVMKSLLQGKDTFVIMPTGGGKSLCYQLPALILQGTAIVISPLISLMKNQVDAVRNISVNDGIAHFLNSSLTKAEIKTVKEDLLSGVTKLLYVAPESLTKEENIEFFNEIKISFFAIDEAHCISEWGHDFRPEYRKIRQIINAIDADVPLIALTATATPKVQLDIQKNLGMIDANVYISSFDRKNLYYEVKPKTKDVVKDIIRFIREHKGKSGIIYCLSRKKVEEIAEVLQLNDIKALPYHAGLESQVRMGNQDKFLMEDVDVIVATIAFGMGIDKPDVRYVIHYDIPKSLEGYYQETGRAGRDDGEGKCVTYYSFEDIQKFEKFLKGKTVNEQDIAQQLLLETISYAEASICRRKIIMHYFGEDYPKDCGNCDNCLNPKPLVEAKEMIVMLLKTIELTKEQCKAQHLVSILVGNANSSVKQYKHHKLPIFGGGDEYDEKLWSAVVRLCLIKKFVAKDIETFGILKLTPSGNAFIEKPYSVMVPKDQEYDADEDDFDVVKTGQSTGTTDDQLFHLLKELRKKIASKENIPPFVIFQDPSLEDMCIQYPITVDELTNITGVGVGKAQKYGKPFVELIASYVKDNDILRPSDLVVKSSINKSGLKVHIIKNIDKKVPLYDIAVGKGLTEEELIAEIESIVSSGTRLDISYYINELIDEHHQADIYDYFQEAETDSIPEALAELGEDDYSEIEVRLMRIKFMSEMGN